MLSKHRAWLLLPAAAVALAACSSGSTGTATSSSSAGGGASASASAAGGGGGKLTVGVSWNNFNEERWAKADEKAMKEVFAAKGINYISADAGSSADKQVTDVEQLITKGAKAIILLAQDGKAIAPAVKSAISKGVPVIAYDRLIEDPGAFYLSFDNVEVGRMQAQAIFNAVPKGNYVFIKGNSADANADFLRGGQEEVLKKAANCSAITPDNPDKNCPIKNVGETYTDNWAPEKAQTEMEQFLTKNNNKVDAVVASNDGMAGGVVAALKAQGLKIPVSGQDGDAAALNRVALGTQTVSVWKNAFELGKAAAEIAVQLAGGTTLDKVSVADLGKDSAPKAGPAAAQFTTPGGNKLWSLILTPIPVTKDNVNVPIDAGWVTKDVVCKDVPAGAVKACG